MVAVVATVVLEVTMALLTARENAACDELFPGTAPNSREVAAQSVAVALPTAKYLLFAVPLASAPAVAYTPTVSAVVIVEPGRSVTDAVAYFTRTLIGRAVR